MKTAECAISTGKPKSHLATELGLESQNTKAAGEKSTEIDYQVLSAARLKRKSSKALCQAQQRA